MGGEKRGQGHEMILRKSPRAEAETPGGVQCEGGGFRPLVWILSPLALVPEGLDFSSWLPCPCKELHLLIPGHEALLPLVLVFPDVASYYTRFTGLKNLVGSTGKTPTNYYIHTIPSMITVIFYLFVLIQSRFRDPAMLHSL